MFEAVVVRRFPQTEYISYMNCRVCGGVESRKLISLGNQPLANKYPSNEGEFPSEFSAPLDVYVCQSCLSAQIPEIHSRSEMFVDYYYLSSVNEGLDRHFCELARELNGSRFVVDVGSNDGVLLRHLKSEGVKFLGVDPSVNVGAIANSFGLDTLIGFFDANMVRKIREDFGQPEHIVASSVVTHLEDPQKFFLDCKKLLAQDGTLIVEIEYFGEMLSNLQFERFYFDRPHYYSLNGLDALASKAGLTLSAVEFIAQHGGSVRASFRHAEYANKSSEIKELLARESAEIEQAIEVFEPSVKNECEKLLEFLEKSKSQGAKVIAYGCPARFSTITNFLNIDENLIECVVDDSPLKAGRFSPKMHIPIVKYDIDLFKQKVAVLVFAYDYFDSIRSRIPEHVREVYRPIPFLNLLEEN